MIIFGGEKLYNTHLKVRECLNDVRMFSAGKLCKLTLKGIDKYEWTSLKTTGVFVAQRRNHVGVAVGKHLVVHGGVDSFGNYLNDLKVLNLSNRFLIISNLFSYEKMVLTSRSKSVF